LLCQALTQQKLNIRVLGASKNVETPVNAAMYATGNNLTIVGGSHPPNDRVLARRAL
jgi:putative DNA primase/helicase